MARFIDFVDSLGSDNCFRVDGRLSIDSIHDLAFNRAQQLRHINSANKRTYVIIQGERLLNATPITKPQTIEVDRSKDKKDQ